MLGLESEAVSYYERSLALGLPDAEQKAGAMLGLGSTYRTLGEYAESRAMLEQGALEFPQRAEFKAFLAMTLHNLGAHTEAMELLLTLLADTPPIPVSRITARLLSTMRTSWSRYGLNRVIWDEEEAGAERVLG